MLSVKEVKELLQDRNIPILAERVNIHPKTLWALRSGKKTVVSSTTLEKLTAYFKGVSIDG